MDYSQFVKAIHENDTKELNEQSIVITRVLIKFLRVRMNASQEDAEDCVQNTLLLVIEKIRAEKLNNPDSIIYYLFTTAKNDYFKLLSKNKESNYDNIPDFHAKEPDQLKNLLNQERQDILNQCLNALKTNYLEYISYWFEHPGDEAIVVADYFNISVSNAWTKKHRILQILKECVQKNINL